MILFAVLLIDIVVALRFAVTRDGHHHHVLIDRVTAFQTCLRLPSLLASLEYFRIEPPDFVRPEDHIEFNIREMGSWSDTEWKMSQLL